MAFSETEIRYNRISDNANVASVLGLFSVRTESKAERKVRMKIFYPFSWRKMTASNANTGIIWDGA